mmetsp:Transcript_179835/g.570395  ORF Transcript_179835/g.570395 Transcript_179835/m.570395 type:complete len:324 (+) Transcript_179835:350-1321(+)
MSNVMLPLPVKSMQSNRGSIIGWCRSGGELSVDLCQHIQRQEAPVDQHIACVLGLGQAAGSAPIHDVEHSTVDTGQRLHAGQAGIGSEPPRLRVPLSIRGVSLPHDLGNRRDEKCCRRHTHEHPYNTEDAAAHGLRGIVAETDRSDRDDGHVQGRDPSLLQASGSQARLSRLRVALGQTVVVPGGPVRACATLCEPIEDRAYDNEEEEEAARSDHLVELSKPLHCVPVVLGSAVDHNLKLNQPLVQESVVPLNDFLQQNVEKVGDDEEDGEHVETHEQLHQLIVHSDVAVPDGGANLHNDIQRCQEVPSLDCHSSSDADGNEE